jgi:heme exporter protein B
MIWKETKALIRKEIAYEWKTKYALYGLLLYSVSTIYTAYLAFQGNIGSEAWNSVLWIVLIFASVQGAAKSFVNESGARFTLLFQLANPCSIILSKIIYNSILLSLIGLLSFLIYVLLLGNESTNTLMFIVALLLGIVAFSSILSMVSAIASRVHNNPAILAILSLPLLLPVLISAIRLGSLAILGFGWDVGLPLIGSLLMLNAMVWLLAYLLFPYLWRE